MLVPKHEPVSCSKPRSEGQSTRSNIQCIPGDAKVK